MGNEASVGDGKSEYLPQFFSQSALACQIALVDSKLSRFHGIKLYSKEVAKC